MNHPLNRFHRPRSGKGLREWAHAHAPSCRMPDKLGTAAQPTFAAGFSISVPRIAKPAQRPAAFPPPRVEKPRRRWYQYSLRSLFLLTLIVSLLMSWYASKLKQVLAQKRAVEAILAEKGTVEYDYQFDEAGREIKGAKGHGPAWLRGLLGPDQFDTVVHVWVESAKGMEAVNGLARLRSLSIDARGNSEDPLKYLQDIDGLEELDISGFITDAGLERVRELRHVKCLKLSLQGPSNNPRKEKPITGACLAAVLRSCPTLRELTIDNAELPAAALDQIATLSQLEKLTLFNINSGPAVVFRIDKLTALRELELMDSADRDNGNSLTFEETKGIRSLSRLERLHLWSKAVTDSDVRADQQVSVAAGTGPP